MLFYIHCYFLIWLSTHAEPQEGDVRLVGGVNEGRVEIYLSGQWGTVCDDGWDLDDAKVVCRQLRYSGATRALGFSAYGGGSGPIQLDEVNCHGNETHLADCSHDGIETHDCSHAEDAAVVCESQCEAGQLTSVVSAECTCCNKPAVLKLV